MQQGWVRIIAGVVVGIVIAGLCIMLVELAAHQMLSGDALFGAAVAGLLVGALVGGIVAVRIARVSRIAWVVAGGLFLLSMVNVMSFAHPAWFVPAAIVALVAGGWLATRAAPTPALGR